ncbi:MAG: hypothetical protein ACWA42_07375 [Lutibacter sp.]
MTKKLHLFNSKEVAKIFKETELSHHYEVYIEKLNEGPIISKVGSDDFFKLRYQFFEEKYKKDKLTYFDESIKSLVVLENDDLYDEVILWFDKDLTSQINLWAVCVYLLQVYRKDKKYYLVTPFRDSEVSLNNCTTEQFLHFEKNKIKITRNSLLLFQSYWETVVTKNKKEALKLLNNKVEKIPYLNATLKSYFEDF